MLIGAWMRVVVALIVLGTLAAHGHETERDPPAGWEDPTRFEPMLEALMSEQRQWSLRSADPSPEKCAKCGKVTRVVEDLFTNHTSVKDIKAIVDVLCSALFPDNTTEASFRADCEQIPDLVSKLVTYGEASKANVTNVVCADFAHACSQPCCLSSTLPEQVHLAFAESDMVGTAVSMRAAWVTESTLSDSAVKYSADGGRWTTVPAATDTYTVGGWIGTLYFAVMPELPPNATVQYSVGSDVGGWSAVFNFSTLPLNAGTPERPLRVLGVADMGFGPNGRPSIAAIQRAVDRGTVDVIVHPGDIGYADGDQAWWDDFMRLMEPIMSRVPYMTGPGNHECIWYNCTAYKKRFRMPAAGLGAPSDATYYALRAAPAGLSMLMLNSETWYDTPNIDAVQRAWVSAAFATTDTTAYPFRFVMHHRPLYCLSTSSECTVNAPHLRGQVEGLYRDLGVAAVMVGHVHNYQRTWPVFNGTVTGHSYVDAAAPTNFINGGAGNREGQMRFTGPTYSWAAEYTTERTFMTYTIVRDPASGNVTMEASTIRSRTNEVVDRIVMVRSPRP